MNKMRFGRRNYTEAELDEKRVPCQAGCGQRAERGATFGSLIQNFECEHCGATWVGDRRSGRVVEFTHAKLCVA
jgi:hypothetical protein